MPIGNISKAGKSFSGAAEYDLAQGKYAGQENSRNPKSWSKILYSGMIIKI